jgi:hypothetical protein
MFHAKYLNSSSLDLLKEDFFKFLLYTYKEKQWPLAARLIILQTPTHVSLKGPHSEAFMNALHT